jgi:hypothetical protein
MEELEEGEVVEPTMKVQQDKLLVPVELMEEVVVVLGQLLRAVMVVLILAVVEAEVEVRHQSKALVDLVSSFSNINKSMTLQQFGLSMHLAHGCVQMASMRLIT